MHIGRHKRLHGRETSQQAEREGEGKEEESLFPWRASQAVSEAQNIEINSNLSDFLFYFTF